VGDGAGAGAKGLLGVLQAASESVVALADGAEFVGDVECCEDGYAEAIDGATVSGDGAHFGVDDGGEALDVGGIGATEMIDLVVDIYRNGLCSKRGDRLGFDGRCLWCIEGLVHFFSFVLEEFVHLLQHFFYALAYCFALFGESVELGFGGGLLGRKLLTERGYFGFGGGAGFTFVLDDLYGSEDFLL
jgi:hypothetical protein